MCDRSKKWVVTLRNHFWCPRHVHLLKPQRIFQNWTFWNFIFLLKNFDIFRHFSVLFPHGASSELKVTFSPFEAAPGAHCWYLDFFFIDRNSRFKKLVLRISVEIFRPKNVFCLHPHELVPKIRVFVELFLCNACAQWFEDINRWQLHRRSAGENFRVWTEFYEFLERTNGENRYMCVSGMCLRNRKIELQTGKTDLDPHIWTLDVYLTCVNLWKKWKQYLCFWRKKLPDFRFFRS